MADTKKQNGETKSDAFKRLAEARTGKAIESVLRIGNLANKRNYEYRDEDVKKIIAALKQAVNNVEGQFKQNMESGTNFRL